MPVKQESGRLDLIRNSPRRTYSWWMTTPRFKVASFIQDESELQKFCIIVNPSYCVTFRLNVQIIIFQVPVQMMNIEESFDTYYDQAINTSVLHLPFNSSYSMLLLLPDDMATLENVICQNHVTKWLKWMKSRLEESKIILKFLVSNMEGLTVYKLLSFVLSDQSLYVYCLFPISFFRTYNVYVPKFSIKTSYSLADVLTEMGMTDMFGDRADLSGIAEGQKLAVSEVRIENVIAHIFPSLYSIHSSSHSVSIGL